VRPSDDSTEGSHAVRVSFICTANRARSPFAAALLRRKSTAFPIVVDSFGTLEREGAPALPQAVRAAREFGVDLGAHRARSAVTGSLEGSDLVIGFEPFHIAHAVVVGGAETSRVFLLADLARALAEVESPRDRGDFRIAVDRADAARSASAWPPQAVADPVGGSDRRFLETYEEIDRMVAIVAMRLFRAS
jgi:protein-tyrosine phosphatase